MWLVPMTIGSYWYLFADGWIMSVTMALGSFVAGATSEGGGAVAFPVMTLAMDISPSVARDFSLMIQSVGMVAASITILRLRIQVEWRAVLWAGLGGAMGILLSLDFFSQRISPAYTKMFFVSFWMAFGLALLWMRQHRGQVVRRIHDFRPRDRLILLVVGIIGGSVSGLTGSGLDISIFSVLILGYGLDERVATPSSVILMSTNAVIGFAWRALVASPSIDAQAWELWAVCVPIVVVGAPLGAWFISTKARIVVLAFLLLSIAAQFIAALALLPMDWKMLAFATVVTAGAFFVFTLIGRLRRLHLHV
jgi:uncharacterized membrane protein YfcA